MTSYLTGRLTGLLAVLVCVSVVTFSFGVLSPGDPVEMDLRADGATVFTTEEYEAREVALGLDRPLVAQYLHWLRGAVTGDLGVSWSQRQDVAHLLGRRIPRTVQLTLAAMALAVLLSVPLGALAAVRRGSWVDHAARLGALVGSSLPGYFLAYALIILFAVVLGLLPVFGSGTPRHLVLPAVTLALGTGATLCRITRSTVLEVLGEDMVRTARSKGCDPRRTLYRHALPNGLSPILTVFGLAVGNLLGGVVIVETIFSWPGVGRLTVEAIQAKDFPLMQGAVLFSATAYVLVNFVVDVASAWVDPRVSLDK